MNITFRNGIIKYPNSGNSQGFLQINGTSVDLLTSNSSILLNFSHGTSNYTFEEFSDISAAWFGPFNSGTDYWLYWDIDTQTGLRTFGHTEINPVFQSIKPNPSLHGQIWFDETDYTHYVLDGIIWKKVIRVFAAKYDGITFTPLGLGFPNEPYAGSQVGITNISDIAGKILYGTDSKPTLKRNREFHTTESIFNINGSNIDSLRLESSFDIVKANETIPKYSVVTYIDDSLVALANYTDVESILGIITEDTIAGNTGNIILSGTITNPLWNFSEPVGSNIWVSQNGELVLTDPNNSNNILFPEPQPPIAKLLSTNTILFTPSYIPNILRNIDTASTTIPGIVKLSSAPINPADPIVITNTDPRLSNARTPLTHTHDSESITFASNSTLTSINVENALDELDSKKSNITGTTFTGTVTLNNDPTNSLEAATKKYVDEKVTGLSWIDPIQFINLIADSILSPPNSPEISDTYIIPNTGTASGNWATFSNGDIVQWHGSQWIILNNISNFATFRAGISLSSNTTPFGSFTGYQTNIAIYTNGIWSFSVPSQNQSTLLNSKNDYHAFHQFVYDTKWIEYAGPHSILPGDNLSQSNNSFNVLTVSNGGTVDALTLNGQNDTDFVSSNGDTMTGSLILNANPTTSLEATTKNYVDNITLENLANTNISPIDNDFLYYENATTSWKSKQIATNNSGSPYNIVELIGAGTLDELFILNTSSEYYRHTCVNGLTLDITPNTGSSGSLKRIVILIKNDSNIPQNLILPNNVSWANSVIPTAIGNPNSPKEIIKIEFLEDYSIPNTWLAKYELYPYDQAF